MRALSTIPEWLRRPAIDRDARKWGIRFCAYAQNRPRAHPSTVCEGDRRADCRTTLEVPMSPSGIRQRNGRIGALHESPRPPAIDRDARKWGIRFCACAQNRPRAHPSTVCEGDRRADCWITLEVPMSPSGIRQRNARIGVPREWPRRPAIDRDAYRRRRTLSGWWFDMPSCPQLRL